MTRTHTQDTGKGQRRRSQEKAVTPSPEKGDQYQETGGHAPGQGDQGLGQETGDPGLETDGLEIEDLPPYTKDQRNFIENVQAPGVETFACRGTKGAETDSEAETAA